MIWVVGFVLVIVIGLVVVSLVAVLVAAVIELFVRVALGGALAAGLGIVAGVISNEAGWDGALTGVLIAVLTFIPASLFVGCQRASSRSRKVGPHSRGAVRPASTPLDPHSCAWATANRLAPRAGLATAEQACARVIELTKRDSAIDPEVIDLATTLRRHVPALVDETEELLATADRSERRVAVEELVADLVQLAEQASELATRQGLNVRERLVVRRARLFGARAVV